MLYEGYVAADVARMDTERAERKAAENWRFRNFRSRESKALLAALTAVLGIFVR